MNMKNQDSQIKLGQFYHICKHKQLKVEEWLLHNLSILNSSVSIDSPMFPGYTALHFAVICKNLCAVKLLLQHGVDFTMKNARGQTALHHAMTMILLHKAPKRKHNLIPIIDEILVAHKSNYVNVFDNMGLSHFHVACFRNNCSIVLGFLENKVDFNKQVSHKSSFWPGYTPLHIACRYSILSTVDSLLKFGADVNVRNAAGLTPLHIAIKKRNSRLVKSLFVALKQNSINPIDSDGISLLHAYCIANCKSHFLEGFLQQIGEVNIFAKSYSILWPGYTPLHVAVHYQCTYSVVLLLQSRADINAKDANGVSPFQLAIRKKLFIDNFIYYVRKNIKDILEFDDDSSILFEFYCACINGKLDFIKSNYSFGSEFSINATMPSIYGINLPGYTVLHLAVELGNIEMIEFLLQNGADVCAQDVNGLTPLHLAAYKKDYSIVNIMFSYYSNEVKNPIDNKGLSHLHIACLDNRTVIVKSILDSGAPVDMITSLGETALHFAVRFNRSEVVKVLLDENADFTLQEKNSGSTPLHMSVENRNKEITHMILSIHDRRIINPTNNIGLSHFHIFCMKNKTVLIDQFLQHGIANNDPVKLDSPKYPGFTPLHFAVKNVCTETVKILLSHNFDIATKDAYEKIPLYCIDKLRPSESQQILDVFWPVIHNNNNSKLARETGLIPLHVACMKGDILIVENLLHQGSDVNARTSEHCPTYPGYSPLHLAVKYNNVHTVKVLLHNGADANIADKHGFAPLHLACANGKMKIIDILLSHNANPTAKTWRGLTPLRLAMQSRNDKIAQIILSHPTSRFQNPMDNKGLTYFHIACLRGMTNTVRDYIDSGVNLDEPVHPFATKYSGYTPLHIAVYRKNRRLIDLILGHWTKINIRNREGCTALHLTCTARAASADIAGKLLIYGADPDARNNLGDTLVELAIKYDKMEMVEMAIKHKADPNLVSPQMMNYRPLELAIALQRENIVGLLLKNGAFVHYRSPEGGTLIHQTIQLVQVSFDIFIKKTKRPTMRNLTNHHAFKAKEAYYAGIFTLLMEHGCDLNATDATARTALHRSYWPVNLAALRALLRCGANIDAEDRTGRTIVSYFFEITTSRMPRFELYEILRKHLQLRKLAGFPLSRTNELLYERLLEENENYFNNEEEDQQRYEDTLARACETELQRMRSTHFGGYVSLYEMFRSVNKMATHLARNGGFVAFLKSPRFVELFPECGCLVMMQYGRALTRKDLLRPAIEALDALIGESYDELCWNMECSDAVIDYLNNADLCSLAAAVRAD